MSSYIDQSSAHHLPNTAFININPSLVDYVTVMWQCQYVRNRLAKNHGIMRCRALNHLFSMRICTLWTKSRAIIKTCGTSWRSAISRRRSQRLVRLDLKTFVKYIHLTWKLCLTFFKMVVLYLKEVILHSFTGSSFLSRPGV